METQVEISIGQLSSGTIASLTNLGAYTAIDSLRELLGKSTKRWVKMGALSPDAPWQTAWNLYKQQHDFFNEGES